MLLLPVFETWGVKVYVGTLLAPIVFLRGRHCRCCLAMEMLCFEVFLNMQFVAVGNHWT